MCHLVTCSIGESFLVTRKGTAIVNAITASGEFVALKMQNTLISSKFPYKLLALQPFTAKGFQVTMLADEMRIAKPEAQFVLVGDKDEQTRLFFLRQAAPVALLARSYTDDSSLLWQLHLRHGHRNFADLARQYHLRLPKAIPACTSCIMGKSHVYPHLSSGFERATRVAQGFHSDIRGPFSVLTPRKESYLLTLIDDFSRRVFGFQKPD